MITQDEHLPRLRDDLEIRMLTRGGIAVAQLYDPLRHRFFELSQSSTQMLRLWHAGTQNALMAAGAKRAALFTADDLGVFKRFLVNNNLVKLDGNTALLERQRQHRRSWRARFSKLLFMRLPMGNPSAALAVLEPILQLFLTRVFFWLSLGALGVGLFLLSGMPEQLTTQFVSLGTLQGTASLLFAGVLAKIVHELGHAMQALKRGIPVTGFGIIFMLGLPLPYTELSGTWRLEHSRDRMFIAGGGLIAELLLACWMILLFGLLPEGEGRTLAFSIATISLLLSFAVNLNPLMRFDGYHMLSDLLDVKNLQSRSDAMAKWRLRKVLFGLNDPVPETLERRERRFLAVFAVCVWIYRFFLYLGIAALLFALLPLSLGGPLAVTALAIFIGLPIWAEVKVWLARRASIAASPRAWITVAVFVGGIALMFVPMSQSVRLPARLVPFENTDLIAERDARILLKSDDVSKNVRKGQLLWQLEDPSLSFEADRYIADQARIEAELSRLSSSTDALAQSEILKERLLLNTARLEEIASVKKQMQIVAPMSGNLSGRFDEFYQGRWVKRGDIFGTLSDFSQRKVVTLVPSEMRNTLDWDAGLHFYDQSKTIQADGLHVSSISDQGVSTLDEAEFLQSFGGQIPVSASDKFRPKGIWYKIESADFPQMDLPQIVISGHVAVARKPISMVSRMWRRIAAVLTEQLAN